PRNTSADSIAPNPSAAGQTHHGTASRSLCRVAETAAPGPASTTQRGYVHGPAAGTAGWWVVDGRTRGRPDRPTRRMAGGAGTLLPRRGASRARWADRVRQEAPVIFSRSRRGGGRHHRPDETPDKPTPKAARHAARRRTYDEFGVEPDDGYEDLTEGPYDAAEAPDGVDRVDLGSLEVPAVPDVEIRVQADPNGQVQQVILVHGDNALQLGG